MIVAALLVVLFMAEGAAELYRRGVDLFTKGDAEGAAAVLTEAAKSDPRDPMIQKALGVVYASRADYERAQEPLEKACELAPDLPDACYYLGRNLYALNRFAPSLEALKKALKRDSNSARVRLGIAQAYEALGRTQEAETQFQDAIKAWTKADIRSRGNPDFDPNVHYAVFLMRQGRQKEALQPARIAVSGAPRSARARFELGRIHYLEGNLEQAEAELRQAVTLGHGNAARLLLGKTLLRTGREEEARPYLSATPE